MGGFVRLENGVWYDVGETYARNKIAQVYVIPILYCRVVMAYNSLISIVSLSYPLSLSLPHSSFLFSFKLS
jgi:hypothetical protein